MPDPTPPEPSSPSTPGPASTAGPVWTAGPVTRLGDRSGVPPAERLSLQVERSARERLRLRWFAGAAGGVLVIGLVVVLAMTLGGNPRPFGEDFAAPPDLRPPLARMCPLPATPGPVPAPSVPADPPVLPSPPAGSATASAPAVERRTVDEEAGISYTEYPAPWQPWETVWNAGTLEVPYRMGQHFVTEPAYDGFSDYHASILSAAVPAAENDALTFNLECVGRRVAADVRAEYYPQPSRMELLRDERTTLGGRPAWVTVFRLHFSRPGLRATDELAAVACVDVGRATAAILYISVPGTHRQWDWIVEDALASVRPV